MDADKSRVTSLYHSLAEYVKSDKKLVGKLETDDYALTVKERQTIVTALREQGKSETFHNDFEGLGNIQTQTTDTSLKRLLNTMYIIDTAAFKISSRDKETTSDVVLQSTKRKADSVGEMPETHKKVSCLSLGNIVGTVYSFVPKLMSATTSAFAWLNPMKYQIGIDSRATKTTGAELATMNDEEPSLPSEHDSSVKSYVEKEQAAPEGAKPAAMKHVVTEGPSLPSKKQRVVPNVEPEEEDQVVTITTTGPPNYSSSKMKDVYDEEEEKPSLPEEEPFVESSNEPNYPDVEQEKPVVTMHTDQSDKTLKSSFKPPHSRKSNVEFAANAKVKGYNPDEIGVRPKYKLEQNVTNVQIKKGKEKGKKEELGKILTPTDTRYKIPDIDKYLKLQQNRKLINDITGLQDQADKLQVDCDEINDIIKKIPNQQRKPYEKVNNDLNEEISNCRQIYAAAGDVRDNLKFFWVIEAADEKNYTRSELKKLAQELKELGEKQNYPTDLFEKPNLSLNDIKAIANAYKNRELGKLKSLKIDLKASSERIKEAIANVPRPVEDD